MSASPKTPRRSETKRAAILQAATRAFVVKGFDGANLDDIALDASVSKRTIYMRFTSKDQLFVSVVEHLLAELSLEPIDRPHPDLSLAEQLLTFAQQKVAIMVKAPSWHFLMRLVMSTIAHNPQLARKMLNALNQEDIWLSEWFRAADENSQLTVPTPSSSSRLFWSTIWGAVLWPRLLSDSNESTEDEATVREIVQLFLARHAVQL
jgi:TetR/AcrR family transcriptional regulator, regulator of autoinduction and epiphytic fitness